MLRRLPRAACPERLCHPTNDALLQLLVLLLLALLQGAGTALPARAQAPEALAEEVEALIEAMSPEQRVGQLFLVTFPGAVAEEEGVAATLVRELRVGGVALRASNGNFVNSGDTATALTTLTNSLQALAQEGSAASEGPFVPLFIASDLYSPNPLLADGQPQNGFTRVPSGMAIGATWDRQNARSTGQIVGQELAAVGVNMLLGPALDVMDATRAPESSPLDTRTFGGNPYWVGEMGRAFIQGVAEGSGRRVATVATHFPGLGSSDRRPDEEIATVQKLYEALAAEDLPPFYAVTQITDPLTNSVTADGLLTANVRYRALQGSIRQTTRPLSLDAQSLPTLLNDARLQPWRQQGGIVVSEELGALALRRFYQEQTGTFPAAPIARDAFNAGNDLLFLSDFALEETWDARVSNIEQTLRLFADQYQTDTVFATRVDESLRRLLALKLRLYGEAFAAAEPLPNPATLEPPLLQAPESLAVVARIAQEAATLLYPTPDELAGVLPAPPLRDENLLIVTDVRPIRDCPTCVPRPTIDPLELETQLLQRFGPQSSNELNPERLTSLTFADLETLIAEEASAPPPNPALLEVLDEADWLIFLVQDEDPLFPESDALRAFLRRFNPQLRGQRVVVFSFGAPSYLDSTEVGKVTAYYGLYSPAPRFVDAAASLLFQTLPATGMAPVSLPALNFDLNARLAPNPNQSVGLCRDAPEIPLDTCEPLPQSPNLTETRELGLRTSIILDHNGNAVPDGSSIQFVLRYPNEGVELRSQLALTVNGVARTTINLGRDGQLSITAVPLNSAPFASTEAIVTIQGSAPPVVETVVPTLTPTPTPTLTRVPTPSATLVPTPRPSRTPVPRPTASPTPRPLTRFGQDNDGFGWWVLAVTLLGLGGVGSLGFATLPISRTSLVRRLLLVVLYGVSAYMGYLLLYALHLLPADFNGWGAIAIAMLGGFFALVRDS